MHPFCHPQISALDLQRIFKTLPHGRSELGRCWWRSKILNQIFHISFDFPYFRPVDRFPRQHLSKYYGFLFVILDLLRTAKQSLSLASSPADRTPHRAGSAKLRLGYLRSGTFGGMSNQRLPY